MDQRIGSLSFKFKNNRWTIVSLCYALDTALHNSMAVHDINNGLDAKKTDSFIHGCSVSRALVTPHMKNRPLDGLQSNILKKRAIFLGLPMPGEKPEEARPSMIRHPKQSERKSFCSVCYAQLPHEDRRKAKVVKE